MKRIVFILAILCATVVMFSSTVEAHRWSRGYYGHRGGYYAPYHSYYTGYRDYHAYPRYYGGYHAYPRYYGGGYYGGGYYGRGYYGGYGGHCGW